MNNPLEEFGVIMKSYYEDSVGMGIDALLKTQDKLSTLSYYTAELCSSMRDSHNEQKAALERSLISGEKKYRDEGVGTLDAKTAAKFDNVQQFKDKAQIESDYKRLKNILSQVNKVLTAIQQRISYLKKEKEEFKLTR